jgi:hypothetical protein
MRAIHVRPRDLTQVGKGSHSVWLGHDFVEVAQEDGDAIASTVHEQGEVELSSCGGRGLLQG